MRIRPYVDHDGASVRGACVLELPQVFGYQDGPEQLAVVLPGAADLTEEGLRDAASLCPVEAIRLLDADDNDMTPEA